MPRIQSLIINDDVKNYKSTGENTSLITNISKLNIFIGSNNSGKSKFLRNVLTEKKLKINKGTDEINSYNKFVSELSKDMYAIIADEIEDDKGSFRLVKELTSSAAIDYRTEKDGISEKLLDNINKLKNMTDKDLLNAIIGDCYYHIKDTKKVIKELDQLHYKYLECYKDEELNEKLKDINFERIYIPILRGLRALTNNKDVFKERTVIDYLNDNEIIHNVEVFTGQSLYQDVLKLLCGNLSERNKLREFEMFLGENFFDGQEISLIPKIDSDVLYVKIGQEQEQPIYNLGDGIQSIIILTFKLFANKGKNILFFIEEPELYLHPGLQRKIIETFLKEEFDTYQYFITSHSNHLLDLTLDMDNISVYKFSKEINQDNNDNFEKIPNFIIDNVSNDDASILKVLGVNNSSIFLSNCTIWVEGITDRFYIRKYLEIYQKEMLKQGKIDKIYSEDIHHSFLEYSGGNITHWDFLDDTEGELAPMAHSSICNKMFLISDSDGYNSIKTGEKKTRLENLKTYFGDKFYCLEVKEIENVLMPEILKKVVFKLNDKRIRNEDKDQDGKLFEKSIFKIDDYKDENIGDFIEKTIDEQIDKEKQNNNLYVYKRFKKYANHNTIARKVEFCKYAIEDIKTIYDMSAEAVSLCEKIYTFIAENNK